MRWSIPALLALASCGEPAVAEKEPAKANAQPPTNGAGSTEGALLILEFPDGVRGGRGKIQGTGPTPPLPGPGTDGIDRHLFDRLMGHIRDCGAADPYLERGWSHRLLVISRSTPNDRAVVRCVRGRVHNHFNAGLGPNDPRGLTGMDETPFRDFETPGGTR